MLLFIIIIIYFYLLFICLHHRGIKNVMGLFCLHWCVYFVLSRVLWRKTPQVYPSSGIQTHGLCHARLYVISLDHQATGGYRQFKFYILSSKYHSIFACRRFNHQYGLVYMVVTGIYLFWVLHTPYTALNHLFKSVLYSLHQK